MNKKNYILNKWTTKLLINEEIMQGQPLALEKHIKMEIANQILQMSGNDYEDVTNNMRIFADVLETIEEHINDDIITFKYNPMGAWYLVEEDEQDQGEEETRTCSECHKKMTEGYCIENGMAYYCSDECLHKNMTQEEYLELYDDGNGDSYYTEWED